MPKIVRPALPPDKRPKYFRVYDNEYWWRSTKAGCPEVYCQPAAAGQYWVQVYLPGNRRKNYILPTKEAVVQALLEYRLTGTIHSGRVEMR